MENTNKGDDQPSTESIGVTEMQKALNERKELNDRLETEDLSDSVRYNISRRIGDLNEFLNKKQNKTKSQEVTITTAVGESSFTIPTDVPQTIYLDVYGKSYKFYCDGTCEEDN